MFTTALKDPRGKESPCAVRAKVRVFTGRFRELPLHLGLKYSYIFHTAHFLIQDSDLTDKN